MASPTSKPRSPTKAQLLKQLAILDSIPDVFLPPTLPPSPPASRGNSPAANGAQKRKHDQTPDGEPANKRARTATAPQLPSPPKTSSSDSSAGSPGQSSVASAATSTSGPDFVPTPVKHAPVDPVYCKMRQATLGKVGKKYKHHADSREYTLARDHKRDKANDSREQLLVFIESAETIIIFAYSFWLEDLRNATLRPGHQPSNAPFSPAAWRTIGQILQVTLKRGETAAKCLPQRPEEQQTHVTRVRACLAILRRLEGFVRSYLGRSSAWSASRVLAGLSSQSSAGAINGRSSASTSPPGQQPTPPAVPSPAPSTSHLHPSPQQHSPAPGHTSGVTSTELEALELALDDVRVANASLSYAHESPFIRPDALSRAFPHTFRRLAVTPGTAVLREPAVRPNQTDLFGVDLDAAAGKEVRGAERPRFVLAESELEWPTTPSSGLGAGIGALCCVARAMVWEMGQPIEGFISITEP